MDDDLVTVARFDNSVEANLARNRLEEAGLRAALLDDNTVDIVWALSNALGGVKLQVRAADAEQARRVLDGDEGDEAGADAAGAEPAEGLGAELAAEEVEPDEDAGPPATERDRNAGRALRAALFGLLFWPLQFYAFWLLLKVYLSDEPLQAQPRRHALVAAAVNLPAMLLFCVLVRFLLAE